MKKKYSKPSIGLFETKCHVSSLSPDAPEEIDGSRRSLVARVGLIATVGHISLYGGSLLSSDAGPGSTSSGRLNTWTGETDR